MARNETYVDDVGKTYAITVYRSDTDAALDISTANTSTARLVYFTKADGTLATVTSSISGTGSTGGLLVTTPNGLFSVDGEYKMQVRLSLNSGAQVFSTDIYKFKVYPKIY